MQAFGFALGCVGCFHVQGHTVRPPGGDVTLRAATLEPTQRVASIVLTDEVGTDVSVEGERFHGRLARALLDDHGATLAERGAAVDGVVCLVRRGIAPALALDVVSIASDTGALGVRGWLLDAERVAMLDTGEVYVPGRSPYDVFMSAWYLPGPIAMVAPPAGVLYPETAPGTGHDDGRYRIHLSVGVRLEIELESTPSPIEEPARAPCTSDGHFTQRSLAAHASSRATSAKTSSHASA